jgi:NitT/TauT family transport system substrate-binding protein
VDVVQISAAPILTAALGGADVVMIASISNRSVSSLYVPAEIRSAADLKGKPLATDRPGTPNDFTMRKALGLLGLTPTDVNLLPLGSAEIAWTALQSGQVYGGMLSPPLSFQADAAGFRLLQDTFSIPYQATAIVVLRERLTELTPVLPGLLAAYREGIDAYNKQPELAKKVLTEHTKEADPTLLQKTYDFYRMQAPFEESLQLNMEGIQSMLEFLGETLPAAKTAKPEQFVDRRFIS